MYCHSLSLFSKEYVFAAVVVVAALAVEGENGRSRLDELDSSALREILGRKPSEVRETKRMKSNTRNDVTV